MSCHSSNRPRLQGKATGGWTVSGITRFATGFPITLSESDDASLCGCNGADVPNYNGQSIHFLDPRRSWMTQQVGTISLIHPPSLLRLSGTIGNVNRRFFHGPGFNNWDIALHKNTLIGERIALEFRGELFNMFNHAQFENPDGDVAGNIGQVTSARDPRIGQLALKFSF